MERVASDTRIDDHFPVEMKTVATFSWIDQAYMARTLLEGSGIQAFIPDEHSISMRPLIGVALGGVRLQVEDEEYERAREVLETPPAATT